MTANTNTIAELFHYVKDAGGRMTAVALSPSFDVGKGRVSKGPVKAHAGWKTKGWTEKNVRTTPLSADIPCAWMMDLKKLGWYVVDVDVKNGTKAMDALKKEVFDELYANCSYVVETGSKGLHFYFSYGAMEVGDEVGANKVKAPCADWFVEPDAGEIDFITDSIVAEHTQYVYDGVTYSYRALKGKPSEVFALTSLPYTW